MKFDANLLDDHHITADFDSGAPSLDEWLKKWALIAQRRRTSRTFVWTKPDGDAVVAYFSLAPAVIDRGVLPARTARSELREIPAILLGRLALGRGLQGKGLGGELLIAALDRAVYASRAAGGRFVVVDAVDEHAATCYEHFQFRRLPGGGTVRLIRKVTDIANEFRAR